MIPLEKKEENIKHTKQIKPGTCIWISKKVLETLISARNSDITSKIQVKIDATAQINQHLSLLVIG